MHQHLEKDEEEALERYEEHEENERKKRIVIIGISCFLILLVIAASSFGYTLMHYLGGRLISSGLNDDYSFELSNNGKVIFEKDVYENLRQIYYENQKAETKVCLVGYKKEMTYYVNDLYSPRIYKQDPHSVTSQMCNINTIISLHTHPYQRCVFSDQDLVSYNSFKEINNDGLIGLMCEEERLTFFGFG